MAQRVWAMPQCESKTLVRSISDSSVSCLSFATLPTSLNANTSFFLSPSMAKPAESYPRYSRRERPKPSSSRDVSNWSRSAGSQDKTGFARVWMEGAGQSSNPCSFGVSRFRGQCSRTVDECVDHELAVLLHQVVDVTKNATVGETNFISKPSFSLLSSLRSRLVCREHRELS